MRILVTYGWCRTAYVAVKSLARRGHEVYTCSSRRPSMSAWSRWTKSSAHVADPFVKPAEFTRDIARLIDTWSIDVVLPGHEDALILRQNDRLLPDRAVLACPDFEALGRGFDKAAFTLAALEAGVPVPQTRFPASVVEAEDAAGF